jgi:hypothetical protein
MCDALTESEHWEYPETDEPPLLTLQKYTHEEKKCGLPKVTDLEETGQALMLQLW